MDENLTGETIITARYRHELRCRMAGGRSSKVKLGKFTTSSMSPKPLTGPDTRLEDAPGQIEKKAIFSCRKGFPDIANRAFTVSKDMNSGY